MGGEVSLKLPFVLGNVEINDPSACSTTLSGLKKLREMGRKPSTVTSNGGGSFDIAPRSPIMKDISVRESDDYHDDSEGINRITELNNQNKRMPGRSVSVASPNRMPPVKDNGINNRRELFKNSKFNDNLNSTIDVITEDFQTITANISNLVKSDSSKSNLNETGPCQQEISVEAQIHCPRLTDDGLTQN